MTTYTITHPRKQGSIYVVDIIEKVGNSITRRATLRWWTARSFIRSVFGSIPENLEVEE